MTVIDLGELTELTDPPARQRRSRPGGRRMAAVVVALITLIAVAGAAPSGRIHAIVPVGLGSDLFIVGDQILTLSPRPGFTDGSQDLLAYPRPVRATAVPQRLTPLWRMPIPPQHRVYWADAVPGDGIVIAMAQQESRVSATLRLDARTGQERWRVPGMAMLDLTDRALLRTFSDSTPNVLRMIDLDTARELWSMPLSAASVDYRQRDDGGLDVIVVATIDGEVQVIDPDTGAVRHRLPAPDDQRSGYQQAWLSGDLVTLVRNSRTLVALTVDGLVERWRATVPTAAYVTGCGPMLCAGLAGGGLQVVDPATGAMRWRNEELLDLVLVDDRNALAMFRDTNEMATVTLSSGAVLIRHGPWRMVARYEYAPDVLAVRTVPEVGAVLAQIDPTGAPARRIDVLPGASGDCQSRSGLVACRLFDGNFGIWRLPH
ncbi:PQQ-binding-like beta-propeller repeat protein [Micromonospora sp. CP22]|uniref:outer membrane protein assembly factor BamB family protein n=1 Tax=Micromonospora sp. CP22 TaxID=2580517 RepID=UPI0018AD2C1F|nr:PQQ-binding-like beta-propeller repeat protein [Micromonospora sp. CP22]